MITAEPNLVPEVRPNTIVQQLNPFAPVSFPWWDWYYDFSSKWYLWNPASSSYILNINLAMKTFGMWIIFAILQWIIISTCLFTVDLYKTNDIPTTKAKRWWMIAKRVSEISVFMSFFMLFIYLQADSGSDSWKVILWIFVSWVFFANAFQTESIFMWIFSISLTAALPFILRICTIKTPT